MDEFTLIEKLFAPLAQNDVARGLADDAACYTPPDGHDLVLSTDALVADVHFPADAPPEWVAARAVACNMSDLAAKGAEPVGVMLTLGIGAAWDEAWLTAFAAAFGGKLAETGAALWGGDSVRSATAFVSLGVHGLVPHGEMIRRDGARAGDDVYLSGTIGDGFLGLEAVRAGRADAAYTDPQPRLALGKGLRGLASACLDVSDGLMADADNLCRASRCGMTLEAEKLPLSPAARAYLDGGGTLESLITGGDDYELLFTADPVRRAEISDAAETPIARIGRIVEGAPPAQLLDAAGQALAVSPRGFRHF